MSLAYHLLLSWFIWCPNGPTGGQGSPFRVAPSFWRWPIICWAYLFAHQDAPAALGSAGSPGKSFLLVEDGIQAPDLASKCIHCFWAFGMALLSNIFGKQSWEFVLCVLRVILISVFIYLKTTCLFSHVQFQFNTTGHGPTLPLVYL